MTPENFLKFYKKRFILNKVKENENYYIVYGATFFRVHNFSIENLPFKNSWTNIELESQFNILVAKNIFDLQLEKFAKIVMEFWHYFKLETYYDNYRLVFKLDQTIFDDVVKTVGSLKQTSELKTLAWIFKSIFKNFNSKFNVHLKLYEYFWNPSINFKISWTKNEKSFIVKVLYETNKNNTISRVINFYDNSFKYSFFINPSSKDLKIDNDKYSFLHIIEFEVG